MCWLVGEVYEILSSLTEVTNSAVQPCDLLHRGSKVLQFDFSGEGKNKKVFPTMLICVPSFFVQRGY